MSLEQQQLAWKLLQQAYQAQMHGDYDHAVELYTKSLETFPTAEAHTFLGWTYHFQGKVDEAIAECKRAIEVDPDFGNPYNDIGSYLIALGRFDEAIPWLQQGNRRPSLRPAPLPVLQPRPRLPRQRHAHQGARILSGSVAHRAAVRSRAAGHRKSATDGELRPLRKCHCYEVAAISGLGFTIRS